MSLDKEQLFRTFGEGLIVDRISKAIAKLGYIHPTLIQAKMIPIALRGRDVLARARTGIGKDVCVLNSCAAENFNVENENVSRSQGPSGRSVLSKELCHQTLLAFQQLSYYMSDMVTM